MLLFYAIIMRTRYTVVFSHDSSLQMILRTLIIQENAAPGNVKVFFSRSAATAAATSMPTATVTSTRALSWQDQSGPVDNYRLVAIIAIIVIIAIIAK